MMEKPLKMKDMKMRGVAPYTKWGHSPSEQQSDRNSELHDDKTVKCDGSNEGCVPLP